jgi:hypothetical protein
MSISKDTLDWLHGLPAPDDADGWRKRMADNARSIFGGPVQPVTPLPWDDNEEPSHDA